MKLLLKSLRALFIWVGPVLILLFMVMAGFGYWVVSTQAGTRWALVQATELAGGQIANVQGTIRRGVQVGRFDLFMSDTDIQIRGFQLQVDWAALLDRSFVVRNLAVDDLKADIRTSDEPSAPSEPFKMPALPGTVVVDRLALGHAQVTVNGQPIPVGVRDLVTQASLDEQGVRVGLHGLTVQYETMQVDAKGQAHLAQVKAPWPFTVQLDLQAQAQSEEALVCVHHYVPSLPSSASCETELHLNAQGSLDSIQLAAQAKGQQLSLDASAVVQPEAVIPVRSARLALVLPDLASVDADVEWSRLASEPAIRDRFSGHLKVNKLDLGALLEQARLPEALLSFSSEFDVVLQDQVQPLSVMLDASVAEGSRWNKEPLQGTLQWRMDDPAYLATTSAKGASAVEQPAHHVASTSLDPVTVTDNEPATHSPHAESNALLRALPAWVVQRFDTDITLGKNHIRTSGAFGSQGAQLLMDISAPVLAAFWPELPGGVQLKGQVSGSVAEHRAELATVYTPADAQAGELGKAPVEAKLQLEGQWKALTETSQGWVGRLQTLALDHAGIRVASRIPVVIELAQTPSDTLPQWRVERAQIDLLLRKQRLVTVNHVLSQGTGSQWATQGNVARMTVSPRVIEQVQELLGSQAPSDQPVRPQGGVRIKGEQGNPQWSMDLGANWDFKFIDALQGSLRVRRLSGDVVLPTQPVLSTQLSQLDLALQARPQASGNSSLNAVLNVNTRTMGRLAVNATTLLHHNAQSGFFLDPADSIRAEIKAAIDNLDWVSQFTGDQVELGGKVSADLSMQVKVDGTWQGRGDIRGDNLRIVSLDQGIRLLDGTLRARLQNERLILESLSFPAVLRVTPKEWRTAEWISQNPDAKGGSLTLTGDWDLKNSDGQVGVRLYRYPILQRSDRYAMVSGDIAIKATLPAIDIQGQITADAGWFDIDMLNSVPTLDSDVIVLKPGEQLNKPAPVPLDLSMRLKLDLGPRFYLTGYGLNSGLVGDITLTMAQNKLTALGALRTRGGAIEAYGQRLQLRRGTITFQGDIANPILNIEALRTGLQVEAGVRVAGTARRPRIDLVSYPEVSEIEKLSWLLLGHGPNDSGGDMALLFSVGSSFLTEGEPFYRKFGIDEVSMRSGSVGAAGSILPADSVVSRMESGPSNVENRFVAVSKFLSGGITAAIHQALSDTGTVGRLSYELTRGLNAEVTAGTVSGLALVYRWFSRD